VKLPLHKQRQRSTPLAARGEPMVWLTSAGLGIATLMVVALLTLITVNGLLTFWPKPLVQITTTTGDKFLGEISRNENYRLTNEQLTELSPSARDKIVSKDGWASRQLLRSGNYDLYGDDFKWINLHDVSKSEAPTDAWIFERLEWGSFIGFLQEVRIDNKIVGSIEESDQQFRNVHGACRARHKRIRKLEKQELGSINHKLNQLRLQLRSAELKHGKESSYYTKIANQVAEREYDLKKRHKEVSEKIRKLRSEDNRYTILLTSVEGRTKEINISQITRAYPANRLNFLERLRVYASRWWEFLTDEPREANTEGGVMPAIFGTIAMTLIMTFFVAPFGIVAALYMREYAKQGPVLSAVRIAVNNLAGVPSIVFGVFGLGFFCYVIGGSIDSIFFAEKLPTPTFGTGGLLWASLTLALLTVPVVIVATEEALAAVPSSSREGSYACGASKWQTIRRIVLPRAMPGIMTGLILAMARGAGEVAPLMITGVVKLAPELPVDGNFPFLHFSRSFMHLGFHIFDVGFQSRNSEAGKPMVYATALLLILLITLLNVTAIMIRSRLRRRFAGGQF